MKHIYISDQDPTGTPTAIGAHWINRQTRREWFSIGTGSVADWSVRGGALIPPRVTRAQRNALSPEEGQMVHQTDNTPGLRQYVSGGWVKFTTSSDA